MRPGDLFAMFSRDLPRVECAFELIRGDEDEHSLHLQCLFDLVIPSPESLRG